uniref:2-phosphosulfolactate phosphatase n=1 Tax=Paulinella chromatophora TaxID=39717 RepID=B1X591_PAUCH|nr:2-phosphosulfolactate phosphatase [Paulinella chromatophora]ACB43110.1 2-phosphosulfolactate phosphatase [Paulinella chromatophora]
MHVSYFHVAADVPNGPLPDAAIVIDVLRATTTIAWSLRNGAEAIHVFADLNVLRSSSESWPAEKRLLAGERGGARLEGFDLGNSPVAVTRELVSGKRIFMSTTNGTRSLDRVRDVPLLITACLSNRSAVSKYLIDKRMDTIWIVGSGWEGAYSLEDSLAAGAVAESLGQMICEDQIIAAGNDELIAASVLWSKCKNNPERCLRAASHGRRLISLGNHDEDFKCCAAVDSLDIVPIQTEPGVLKIS